jgi:hypothetical protein
MPQNTDEPSPVGRRLILAVAIGVVLLAAAATYRVRDLQSALIGAEGRSPAESTVPADASRPEPSSSSFTLFVPQHDSLVRVFASSDRQPDARAQAETALRLLLADKQAAAAPVLKDLRLRGVYVDASGVVFVDFAQPTEIRASARDEELALHAVVDSVLENVPDAGPVAILIEGKEAASFAGHIDLSRKYAARSEAVTAK